MNHKLTSVLILLLICVSVTHASVLATISMDKKNLAPDEVGMLTVKLFNDGDTDVKNLMLRVQSDAQLLFIETDDEKTVWVQNLEKLASGTGAEIKLKVKATTPSKTSTNIYLYYGLEDPLPYASVTTIGTKELPITSKATLEKKNLNGKDVVVVNFLLTNTSKENLTKASAALITPKAFENITAPVFLETLAPTESINKSFQAIVPLETTGEQTILLAYGYFDSNTPHYFEKEFKVNFQKPNYTMIALVGILVLIAAGYLYIRRETTGNVKGTAEKKK